MAAVPPPVAVAVVSFNTRALLDACLRSLRADRDAGRAEVWVVDNGSTDGSAELVRDAYPWARLVVRGDNPGFGAAVNLVAARTQAAWVAPANADLAVAPGALAALLAAGAAHPRAGILAPRLQTPDGRWQHSVHPFPGLGSALVVNAALGSVLPAAGRRLALDGHVDPDAGRWVDWAHGALLLVRRAAWDAAGGFDDAQWLYAEDLDLCWRARRAGWRTRYVPEAVVVHHVSAATSAAFGDERDERAQRAAYAWAARRLGPRRARALARVNVAGARGRAALLLAAGPRAAARRAELRRWARLHATGLER